MQIDVLGRPIERASTKIRCPSCFKPYSVQRSQVQVEKPRFQCRACQQVFWVRSPECFLTEDTIGLPLSAEVPVDRVENPFRAPRSSAKIFNCPKCAEAYGVADKECGKCGLVFKKFEEVQNPQQMHRGHPQLKRAWEDLVANFQDVGAHIRFVEEAEKRHDLAYAAERYTRISEAAPDNEIAKDMLKDIEERVARGAAVRSSALNLKVPNSLGLMIALALGVAMVVAGFVAEPLRNITGIGMALIFLSIASRFLFVGR